MLFPSETERRLGPDAAGMHVDILFNSDPGAIEAIAQAILAFVRDIRWTPAKTAEIETALLRALTGAIGPHPGNGQPRKVRCCVAHNAERGTIITLRDPGRRTVSASIPCPVIEQTVCSSEGRGIYLINELDDQRSKKARCKQS